MSRDSRKLIISSGFMEKLKNSKRCRQRSTRQLQAVSAQDALDSDESESETEVESKNGRGEKVDSISISLDRNSGGEAIEMEPVHESELATPRLDLDESPTGTSRRRNNVLGRRKRDAVDDLNGKQLKKAGGEKKYGSTTSLHDRWSEEEDEVDPHCVLMPENPFKSIWDVLMIVLLGYVLIVMPLRVAFYDQDGIDPVELTVDSLFFIDIILTFFTAYEDKDGKVITKHNLIAKNYLKGWFVLDVVATFPFYLVGNSAVSRLSSLARVPRLLKLFKLVKLLKLLRAYRFRQYFQALEYSPKIHPGTVRIAKIFFLMVTFGHFVSCLWYFIGDIQDENEDSWIMRTWPDDSIYNESVGTRYAVSFYFSISTLTTVGFGDITARTNVEIFFAIFLMICGSTFFAYTTATVSSIITSMDVQETDLRNKMDRLRLFIKSVKLSGDLTKRVTRDMRAVWKKPNSANLDWSSLLVEMPKPLREKVSLEMYSDLIVDCPLFQQLDSLEDIPFITATVDAFRPVDYPPGETIGSFGDRVEEWYLVMSGKIEAVSSATHAPKTYLRLGTADTIGDMELFMSQRWSVTYKAHTKVNLLACPAKFFRKLISSERYHSSVAKLVSFQRRRFAALKKKKVEMSNRTSLLPSRSSSRQLATDKVFIQPVSSSTGPDPLQSTGKRSSSGGGAPSAVLDQLLRKVSMISESVHTMQREMRGQGRLDGGVGIPKSLTRESLDSMSLDDYDDFY